MYYLMEDPGGGRQGDAFNAIDEVHGTETFSSSQAVDAIINVLGLEDAEASTLFFNLVSSGYVAEVD